MHLGRIDAIFANAGMGLFKPVLDTTEEDARRLFDINYAGTMALITAAIPHLRHAAGGLRHILICSSAAGKVGVPQMGVYSATKAAQDSIASALRAELHDDGFKVSSVHPIGTRTDFVAAAGAEHNKNTPDFFMQPPERVATCILRCLKRPQAEIWPSVPTRLLMALGLACPPLAAKLLHRHWRKIKD